MNLRDLEYLVAVAELGHFGKAAERCHVSQPALSGQIRKLEEELGVTLFERTNRSVRVTHAGTAILIHARVILNEAEVIRETARGLADPFSGTLGLGAIQTIGPDLTPLLLPAIRHHLPRLTLNLTEGKTARLEAALLDGSLDAALTATPPEDPRLSEIPLYREPFWVAVPTSHPLAADEEVALGDIQPNQLLLLSDGHCLRDQALSFCSSAVRGAGVSTQDTSLATILALVGAGAGVTLVPALTVSGPWATDAGIAFRKDASAKAGREVRLIFRSAYPRRPLLEKIADIVCSILPDTVQPERR